MRNIPHQLSPAELKSLADRSHGYVGADLAAVCREAGLKCIKRCAREKGKKKKERERRKLETAGLRF